MKKILLVIFFFAIISVILIYYLFNHNKINVLLLGENIYSKTYSYDTFFYDEITYKEIINNIKSNDYITIKGEKVFLNQLINKSDYVVISSNTNEYLNHCNKSSIKFNNYKNRLEQNINDLYLIITRISNAKLILLLNNCNNQDNSMNVSDDIITIYKDNNVYDKINDIVKIGNKA